MIDTVTFETSTGRLLMPYEEYGLILANRSISPPTPKVYRVKLEGANGSLDMTEWAGEIKYNDRTVSMTFRDMNGQHIPVVQALTGRLCKITFSDDLDHYYEGRCDSVTSNTRKRVTDLALKFTCKPYRINKIETNVTADITGYGTLQLMAARMPVIPTVVLSSGFTFSWENEDHVLAAGTHSPAWFVLSDKQETLALTGTGTVSLTWRDGVL